MATGLSSTEKQAELLKDQGNVYFKKEKLGAAIEAYTEAITLRPNVPIYWTNRALCHRKRNEWQRVEEDCWKALELDTSSVKAHYMLGLALLQRQQYEDAVKKLEKALELGRGGKSANFLVEEIWQEVAKARYREWKQTAGPRQKKQRDLRDFCAKALKQTHEKATVRLKKAEVDHAIDVELPSGGAGDNDDMASGEPSNVTIIVDAEEDDADCALERSKLTNAYKEKCQTLDEVFDKAVERDTPAEIPEYLCCKITMDIFRDPVIAPSGVTYERAVLIEHLQKVGKFDPLTRAPLQPDQLVPNLAIKEAVQAFLTEHGWAYKLS